MNLTFLPGSYIITTIHEPMTFAARALGVSFDQLARHPDVSIIRGDSELSLGIGEIRQASYLLSLRPIASTSKFLIINDFHFATIEAQNAFLKTFEEPPEYAYIFLVTPYIDRLLKTIVSRAQVIENAKFKNQNAKLQFKIKNLESFIGMIVAERLLWLEEETKTLKDKAQIKMKLLEIIDAFLNESLSLAKEGRVNLDAVDYLKEAKWKVEQGFPLPKLLLESFLVRLP